MIIRNEEMRRRNWPEGLGKGTQKRDRPEGPGTHNRAFVFLKGK